MRDIATALERRNGDLTMVNLASRCDDMAEDYMIALLSNREGAMEQFAARYGIILRPEHGTTSFLGEMLRRAANGTLLG